MEYLDLVVNLLTSTVLTAPDPATTGTSLQVQLADADNFPNPATDGEYNLVLSPAGYEITRATSEIVRVTGKSGGGFLTITRAQEGTTARSVEAGWEISMNITAKMMEDIDAELVTTNAAIPTDFDDLADGVTNKAYTATEKTKLAGIDEGANDYTHPNHSGDVTSVADGPTTIANSAVTNAKMADMATKTYKGRTSAGTGVPEDVSVSTLKTDLSLSKSDVGLGNVDNTSDATKNSATATLTNKTINGDNNTISNLAHGSEVDNPSSGVHGVTGNVVGTTDTQTLTNKTLGSPLFEGTWDGWISADETWTYASADDPTYTFTISGDKTSKYSAGMRIKLTQTTVKYFIITKVAYSDPNTTITVYGGTDYDLAAVAITSPYYSMVKAPQGFPLDPDKWTVETVSTVQRSTTSTSYTSLTDSLNVPIGVWNVEVKGIGGTRNPAGTEVQYRIACSTSESSASNTKMELWTRLTGASSDMRGYLPFSFTDTINIATKTTYYMIGRLITGSQVFLFSDESPTYIRATCAYL